MLIAVFAEFRGRRYLLESKFANFATAEAAVKSWKKPFQPKTPGAFPLVEFYTTDQPQKYLFDGGDAFSLDEDLTAYDELFGIYRRKM